MSMSSKALEGIRIVDFSHVYQGPVGSQLLADYGADVIKIERPGFGDWSREWGPYVNGVSLPFAGLNRNKRSAAFDLKSEQGKEIARALINTADVLIHNFRPGVMEKLGLGYEELSQSNPRLVYAYSSGWGDRGPYVEQKLSGHDMLARAAAGWFTPPAPGQAPVAVGISSDYPAGLMLMIGILVALQARQHTGKGQLVTTDLFSVALHAHSWEAAEVLNKSAIDDAGGIGATEAAIEKVFATQDGYIEISPVFSADALRDISVAMGMGNLADEARFATLADRMANRQELNALLGERFRQKTTAEWVALLLPQGVLCTGVRTFEEALDDPQTYANEMVIEMADSRCGNLRLLGTPLRLSATRASHSTPPPDVGEHTEAILLELGYSESQVAELQQAGVLGEVKVA